MAKNDESTISQQEVWDEHLREVHVGRHWAYIAAVLAGGFLLMVVLMAVIGGGGG